jgi:hypothetical protein
MRGRRERESIWMDGKRNAVSTGECRCEGIVVLRVGDVAQTMKWKGAERSVGENTID